jgi:acetyl esterase/lipase
LSWTLRPVLREGVPLALQRAVTSGTALLPAPGVEITRTALGSVPCELSVTTPGSTATVLYVHGGGFVFGSARGHRPATAGLARLTGAAVYSLDYRLAPEHPYPAAVDDVVLAYRCLLAGGRKGSDIVIAGDSAGGNLTLAAAHVIRDGGLPLPAGLVMISPALDLTLSGASVTEQAGTDPLLTAAGLHRWFYLYAAGRPLQHPGLSPLFADQRGLPPCLVQVGNDEILRSDSERLASVGPDVELQVYDGLWHAFQLFAGLLPSADEALAEIARFCRRVWSDHPPRTSRNGAGALPLIKEQSA